MSSQEATPATPAHADHEAERWRLLAQLEEWLQKPMLVLGGVWFCLVVVELVWSTSGVFEFLGTIIWIVFLAEFTLRFTLAPGKLQFLRGNVITLLALAAPAFRFLWAFRFLRFARGLRLLRIVGTANRSMLMLRTSLRRRRFGYVLAATVMVVMLGAAGMLAFEPSAEVQGGFEDYADALWWTAMLITTIGSAYWPQTAEGRLLAFLLSLYGLAVLGYITASLASFFIGQEARAEDGDIAGAADLAALRRELALLRSELRQHRGGPEQPD